jgi:hypothetical protein
MNINYGEVVEAKIKRLQTLLGAKHQPIQGPHSSSMSDEELTAHYAKKIAALRERGETKTREMVEKINALGYQVTGGRISEKGVHTLKAVRNGYPLFGFVDPGGKLILSNNNRQNVLTINYQRKNLVVHDNFLVVVINGK